MQRRVLKIRDVFLFDHIVASVQRRAKKIERVGQNSDHMMEFLVKHC
jgi:hypothetical protein